MPSTLKALISFLRVLISNFFAKFWSMNIPQAPQSMRVSMICLLKPILMGTKIEFFQILQSKCQDKEILTSIQFSFLKTRILCFFKKLVLFFIVQVFENCTDMSIKLLSVHSLFLFILLSFVFCSFRAFICLMSSLLTFEALTFFYYSSNVNLLMSITFGSLSFQGK